MKQTEIRQQAYKALINSLGIANTLRFLQQLGIGYGDYTQERDQWMNQLTLEDFREFVRHKSTGSNA